LCLIGLYNSNPNYLIPKYPIRLFYKFSSKKISLINLDNILKSYLK
jgi:hypothetical protein